MSGRTYSVIVHLTSVSAVQDLLGLYCGANMGIELISLQIGQNTSTTVALLPVSIKHLPATVTSGSGGAAVTPTPNAPTDPASVFTARRNDTTQATSSGTMTRKMTDVFNTVNGYQWIWPEGDRPQAKPSEALAISLDAAPGGATTMSVTATVRELL